MENGQWKMKSAFAYGLTNHSPFSIFHFSNNSPFNERLKRFQEYLYRHALSL